MPKSALPDWYEFGSDNQSWLMRFKKKWVQIPLAGGPRVPSGFFRFRPVPKSLLVVSGEGSQRFEDIRGEEQGTIKKPKFYFSRIQPWVRWHFALLWPFCIQFHIIYKEKNVVLPPEYKSAFGISRMFTITLGYSFESKAMVYWPSIRTGGNFE